MARGAREEGVRGTTGGRVLGGGGPGGGLSEGVAAAEES